MLKRYIESLTTVTYHNLVWVKQIEVYLVFCQSIITKKKHYPSLLGENKPEGLS